MSRRGGGRMVDVAASPAGRDGGGAQRDGERGAGERRRELALGLVPVRTPPLVQRTSLPELFMAITTGDRDEAGNLLVEDDAQTLTTGQMRKGEFIRELRVEASRVADEELARVGRTSADCPYLDQMLAYYEGRSAEHLERAVRRYAPEARRVRDARDYLPLVGQRLGRGVARWVTTGQMPEDAPNEALAAMAGARGGVAGAVAGVAGLARKAGPGAASTTVDAGALVRELGPGQALDGGTRTRMEGALGHSFAAVRIHADERAAALNQDLAARAFTIGPHVAFGAGELRPGTPHGDALLAHELAHVVQQGGRAPAGDVPLGGASDPLEHDADTAAAAAVQRLHGAEQADEESADERGPQVRGGAGMRLQRCQDPPPPVPVVAKPPPKPQVDPMIARYGEAMNELRRLAPDLHTMIAPAATLGGQPTRIANIPVTDEGTTVEMRFDLQVMLADSLDNGRSGALFRGPPRSEIGGSIAAGFYQYPMTISVARQPMPTAEKLAGDLYHECVHMRLFMDSNLLDPASRSPFAASWDGYVATARKSPDWALAITAWARHLAGGGEPTPAHIGVAGPAVRGLLEEKFAFNASEARMGGTQHRDNGELAILYLADEKGMSEDNKRIIGQHLRAVFDFVDTNRSSIPAFPAAPAATPPPGAKTP